MNTPKKSGRTKRAKAVKQLTPAELFFYDHAGYSYGQGEKPEDGRIRCAKGLAEDESIVARVMASDGWYYEWTPDWDVDDSWMTPEEQEQDHTWEVCQLFDANDHVLASCGGIVDASPEYKRVMEAELAGEALSHRRAEADKIRVSVQHMCE